MIALTTSLLMWLVAFLDVGGEWFPNVAVENVEWAGRGIPNVYHCRCGVFGCGATRANSRLVGNPSFGGLLPACASLGNLIFGLRGAIDPIESRREGNH